MVAVLLNATHAVDYITSAHSYVVRSYFRQTLECGAFYLYQGDGYIYDRLRTVSVDVMRCAKFDNNNNLEN